MPIFKLELCNDDGRVIKPGGDHGGAERGASENRRHDDGGVIVVGSESEKQS